MFNSFLIAVNILSFSLGNNSQFDFRASGAYIFRPLNQEPNIFLDSGANATIIKGPLVTEIQQNISAYVSQVSRLYAGVQEIENEWLVGPIPIEDGAGKKCNIYTH
jgi:hypothetical protein